MEKLIMAAQVLLSLSLLIVLHEGGHYLAARAFGIRVEKFYLFFDFFGKKLFSFRRGETEYGVGWAPLGGYVKIAGMIDESMDKEQMALPAESWEFRSKPAWQRLIVMLGGIIVNVITGVLIFIFLTWIFGDRYIPANAVEGIVPNSIGREMGLRQGDKIVAVNGQPLVKFNDVLNPQVLVGSNGSYTVERNGQQVPVPIPNDLADRLSVKDSALTFVTPFIPFKVAQVSENSAAEKAGIQAGDSITAINGSPIRYLHELQALVRANQGKTIAVELYRNGQPQTLKANLPDSGSLGIASESLLPEGRVHYSLGEAFTEGPSRAFGVIGSQLQAFGKMFSGQLSARKNLSSFIGIGSAFGGRWNWERFWTLTGLLSMVLALMNLLPIPALDGGYVLFLTYEMLSGRKVPQRVMEVAVTIGFYLLMGLMVFAVFNDVAKLFGV